MRFGAALALLLVLLVPVTGLAQTLRFQTSVGSFDMVLNPTNNPDLQAHVDNMLANVAAGVYHSNVVNRAVDDFVLQIGSFQTDSVKLGNVPFNGFEGTDSFPPIVVDADNNNIVDFDTTGLTNTRGTVSLALSAGNANSGSASFFVNLNNDNVFLDAQNFIPFATISDMATIDRIMGLEKIDLSNDVNQPGSLAYTDVPLATDGDLVVIESIIVASESNVSFSGPLLNALGVENGDSDSPSAETSSIRASADVAGASATSVPEPSTLLLTLLACVGAARPTRFG